MADTKEKMTLATAYEELTGRTLEVNNNSNIFGQLDRAFRQSTDDKLKARIAKEFGFNV